MKNKNKNKNNNAKLQNFILLGANANGLKAKKDSLKNAIKKLNLSCVMIQETKVYRKNLFKLKGFQTFEMVRKNSEA